METNSTSTNRRFAGLRPRFLALVLDFVLLSLLFFPTTRIVKGTWVMDISDHRWSSGWIVTDPICLVFLLMIILYFTLLEGYWGATLGKLAAGIRVIGLDGDRPGLTKSIVRNVLRAVDSLPVLNIVGIVLIARSNERARFGDRVAKTRVVRVD